MVNWSFPRHTDHIHTLLNEVIEDDLHEDRKDAFLYGTAAAGYGPIRTSNGGDGSAGGGHASQAGAGGGSTGAGGGSKGAGGGSIRYRTLLEALMTNHRGAGSIPKHLSRGSGGGVSQPSPGQRRSAELVFPFSAQPKYEATAVPNVLTLVRSTTKGLSVEDNHCATAAHVRAWEKKNPGKLAEVTFLMQDLRTDKGETSSTAAGMLKHIAKMTNRRLPSHRPIQLTGFDTREDELVLNGMLYVPKEGLEFRLPVVMVSDITNLLDHGALIMCVKSSRSQIIPLGSLITLGYTNAGEAHINHYRILRVDVTRSSDTMQWYHLMPEKPATLDEQEEEEISSLEEDLC